jgi:hypothetical protein
MYNNNQRRISIVSGKQGKAIYEQAQKPIGNTSKAAKEARERLRKKGLNI